MAGFLDQPTLLRNSDAHLPPPAITTFTRYSGSTGARRPFHPARTPLAAALNTHLGSVSGRSTARRSSSCASAARSAAANSWCTSPAKRSKSCSAAGCSVSRRSSAFNSLTIWCSWSLLLVAPWGPLSERGFLDIPNQLYPKECCPSSPAQLNSPTRLIDHHELHHRKRRSTRARRATSLRVTLCHRRPSNVSWNPLYPLESLNSRPTPKVIVATFGVGAPDAGNTVSVVTAYGELLGHFLDALQPEPAVLPRVPLIITSSKLREVLLENALQQVLRPWQIASVGLWGWLPWRHLLL